MPKIINISPYKLLSNDFILYSTLSLLKTDVPATAISAPDLITD